MMPVIETLSLLVASETAKSLAKFLWEKVDPIISETIKSRFGGNKPDDNELSKLKTEVKELKDRFDSIDVKDLTSEDVEELKQKFEEIEQNQTPIPSDAISGEVFQQWSERSDLDDEDKALLLKKELELLLDKAEELQLKNSKRYEIQDVHTSIVLNIRRLKEAVKEARGKDDILLNQQINRQEELLRNSIWLARDLLKGF
ncbi:MAG: hypothetical protein ACR2NW_02955 [Thermodesulfobacteriota bacterium]